jgi:FlaG/FlaF family flagellin (archaellin)
MRSYSESRRYALKLLKEKKAEIKPDLLAVSEAIGTILLLAISVSLVGVLAWWVQSLPEPKERIEADLEGTWSDDTGQHMVYVEHKGGDDIDVQQIEIAIKFNGITRKIYQLQDTGLSDFQDGFWSMGDVWSQNIQPFWNWNFSIPEVGVDVKDINTDTLILSGPIPKSGSLGSLPDLKIAEEDISFRFLNRTVKNGEWVNISARIHNIGFVDAQNVIVRFFDGSKVLNDDNKDYKFINSLSIGTFSTVYMNWTPSFFGLKTINVKIYYAGLEENYRNNYASKRLEIEPLIPEVTGPNLEIEDIVFDPITPTHGDWVLITVMIKNVGDEEVPVGTNINLTLWDENGYLLTKGMTFIFNRTITNNITQYENMLPPFTYESQTTYGGKTKIKAEITADIVESDYNDNFLDKFIQILPTILLVDDDGLFETYTKEDTSSYMDAALQLAVGSGQFDVWPVKSLDGPKYSTGDKPLKNYDIVIWMTGYQTSNTLTTNDQNAIKLYLENNGKLWLIGMNILDDLRKEGGLPLGAVNSFTYNYLGVSRYELTGTPDFLYGVIGEELTYGMQLNNSNLVSTKDGGVNLTLRGSALNHSIDGILGNDQFFGENGNMSLKYYNQSGNSTYKVVFCGWEFAGIIDMINRNNLTTQVLRWFGWELEIGTDLAIASKGFSDETPNFMDWITISARVRNNGPKDLIRVRVDFFIIDSEGRETRIPEYGIYESGVSNPMFVYVSGGGGETPVQKKWLAVDVGENTFRVVVDLEDEVEEVSEENNDDFYSPLFVTQLFIGYTILVVDDDNSTNNGGSFPNATNEITDALDELGYFYDTFVMTSWPVQLLGPNITLMKHYNSVIWCTGYDNIDTLLQGDQENLSDYFTRNFPEAAFLGETKLNAWIIGQGILNDLGGPGIGVSPAINSFLYRYLRVQQYTTVGGALPNYLNGVLRDNITHGINYPMIQSALDGGDIIVPTNNAYGMFYQDSSQTNYNALRHNSTNYNLVFMPWVYSLINDSSTAKIPDESYKSELCYLILRWFYYPDQRFELKVSPIDIELSSNTPVLGNAYIIRANVHNLGQNDTNAVVRFLDGETVIDTKSIFVASNGNSTTEVIWTPLFAGFRDLHVAVDPDDDTLEVFDILNNNATLQNQIVYYFYDDMENGTSNWDHKNTIVYINGEGPLDYIENPVYSNVNGTWDRSQSWGFNLNNTEFHSFESSYFTFEPIGLPGKVAMDIVMVLDTSGSMSGEIGDLKIAAKNFIDNHMLDERDRVAIYYFLSGVSTLLVSFTKCDVTGKTTLKNAIDGLSASGGTPIWDSIGDSINYMITQGSTRKPIIIAMTDGDDTRSDEYAPWHNYSQGEKTYQNIDSTSGHDYFLHNNPNSPSESNWYWDDMTSAEHTRYGLLNVTQMEIYTVGLGLRHDNHTGDSCWRFPNGWMGAFAQYESVENSWSTNRNSSIYNESGTTEFNLWRIANTSGGEYFYATQASQLSEIFISITTTIVEETTVSRAIDNSGDSPRSRGSPRVQILFDGLETGNYNGGPWSVGGGWSVQGTLQRSGTYYSRAVGSYTDSSMELNKNLDLTSYQDVKLIFYHHTVSVENSDDMYIDVSTNGGTSWTTIRTWDGQSIEDTSYNKVEIDLSAYDGQSSFRFRFRFSMNSGSEYWRIDDIEIIGNSTASGGGGGKGISPEMYLPGDRNLTTYPFSLVNVTDAKFSFYHKYNLRMGLNGVVVLVGTTNNSGINWSYEYVQPTQPYTNNFWLGQNRYDDYGNVMRWCWNGISGNGKFNWDFIEVDLANWTGLEMVRIRIAFLWASPAAGGGYFIDDCKVEVSRNETIPITNKSVDQWDLTDQHAHSGSYAWWNRDPITGNLSGGLDNSLISRPIDLTNARNATLSAYFKFNLNRGSGRPPDGFRVEISSDNAVTWKAINMGVRTAWGVSGNDSDAQDGIPNDGKSYTGLDVHGQDTENDGWVESGTLTRLNTDLTGWAGSVIIIRFRVITASDSNPYFGSNHCEWASAPTNHKGIMVDDVIIYGYSLVS